MRLLFVLFLLTCCSSLANSHGVVSVKKHEMDSAKEGHVSRYLKGSETIVNKAEDEERVAYSMNTLIEKYFSPDKVKAFLGKNFELKIANAPEVKISKEHTEAKNVEPKVVEPKKVVEPSKYTKVGAWKLIVKGQLKPLAIIVAISLVGGYLAYLVKG